MISLDHALSKRPVMLRLTKPMMHGPAVVRLQELLHEFGQIHVDGVFGGHTHDLLVKAQRFLGVAADGIYGPITKKVAHTFASMGQFKLLNPMRCALKTRLLDISDLHKKPRNYSYERDWTQIMGVTLHQTGCNMPNDPLGWGRCNAHYGLMRSGQPLLLNPPPDMIWHANGLSPSTIGVEIEGNFRGIAGLKNTLWEGGGGPHLLNKEMLEGAKVIRDDIAGRFEEAGVTWDFLYAHRQSNMSRRADPGEDIWRNIAMDWIQNTDCRARPNHARRNGRTLPKEWGFYDGKY